MVSPISVLVFGRDARLLETRRWLLEAAGYRVRTTAEYPEAIRILDAANIRLLILCHTLSTEECGRVLTSVHRSQALKTLALTAGMCGCHDRMGTEVLDAMEGPAKFVSTVDKLVRSTPTRN
ncbi:DNA-binding NtrC family response regulator [Tunturiibacter psychrotolerans]